MLRPKLSKEKYRLEKLVDIASIVLDFEMSAYEMKLNLVTRKSIRVIYVFVF